MWNPTRDQARRFLADAWGKYRAGAPLSGLETKVAGIVAASGNDAPLAVVGHGFETPGIAIGLTLFALVVAGLYRSARAASRAST